MKSTISRLTQILAAIFLLSAIWTQAQAAELPMVQNVRINGDQLTWDAVEGATGYNIQLRFNYLDTVRDGLVFTVTESGEYFVVAFDNNGNFSPAMFSAENRPDFGDGLDNGPSFTFFGDNDSTAYFSVSCFDVDAGESCVASCSPNFINSPNGGFIIGSATGGACSSSSTDFVSSSISPDDYSCTASSFTASVSAQVVCRVEASSQ